MNQNPAAGQSDQTNHSRDRVRRPRRSTVIGERPEILEGRQLLSTDVWMGGSSNWSDRANWSTHVVPTTGDDLVFGAAGTVHSTSLPAGFTAGSLTVQSDFSLSGTINVSGTLPVTVSPNATLTLDATVLKGQGTLTKLGDGELAVNTSNAQQATGLTINGVKGPISLGASGTLPITIKIAPAANVRVGPAAGGGGVSISGTSITGADNSLAGPIEVTSGSTFSPVLVSNGYFALDASSTFNPGKIQGGYFTETAGAAVTAGPTLNGTFTIKPGGSLSVKTADYGSAFADGLPAGQSLPNDFTLSIAPDAGTTVTFGSTISGGGKFVTTGEGTVNLAHGVSTAAGALESATLSHSGDTIFSAAITHLVTPIDVPNSPSLTVAPSTILGLGDSSLTLDHGSVAFSQGAKLALRLDGATAGTQYGQLVAGGAIDLNNAELIVIPGNVPPAGTVFTIVKATGSAPITGQFAGLNQGSTFNQGGQTFQINYSAQAVTITSVAQPSTTTISGPTALIKPNVVTSFSATVSSVAGTPTGVVTFLDGSTVIGSATLSGGVATLSSASLIGGDHTITASYQGDNTFRASQSAPLSEAVRPVTTSLSASASSNTPTVGDSVTLSATASTNLGHPAGQVTFMDGATNLGTSSIDTNGHAQISTSGLGVGNHSIVASYAGDGISTAANSSAVPISVAAVASTVSVGSTVNPTSYLQATNLTATVAPGHSTSFGQPTGTVSFQSGSTNLGTAAVDATGHATLPVNSLPVGLDSVTATYFGDSHYGASSVTTALTQTVAKASTSTVLSVSPTPAILGRPMLFTATVSSAVGAPSGTVQFMNGTKLLGKVSVIGGQAFLVTTLTFAPGQSITATYSGNPNFAGSVSQPMVLSAPTTPAAPPTVVPATTPVTPTPTPTPVPTTPVATPQPVNPTPPVAQPTPITPQPHPVVVLPLPTPILRNRHHVVVKIPKHPVVVHKPVKPPHPVKIVLHPHIVAKPVRKLRHK